MSAPILAALDPSTNFVVCTNASLDGIGAVLIVGWMTYFV
jgi:hypothetical protein